MLGPSVALATCFQSLTGEHGHTLYARGELPEAG
jgi:hypothetical protein